MADKRNLGKHTDESVIVYRILNAMDQCGCGMLKSVMGRVAYPDYDYKTPQGAAFAVAKISSRMYADKLIQPEGFGRYGYEITLEGLRKLRELQASQQVQH